MSTQQFANPAITAFISGVERTDRLPRFPLQGTEPEIKPMSRRISGFLLSQIGNLDVKKRGGRNSRRNKRKVTE